MEDYDMWTYWRDNKGLECALTDYYPNTLASNPNLQLALAQIQNAKMAINKIMSDLSDNADG